MVIIFIIFFVVFILIFIANIDQSDEQVEPGQKTKKFNQFEKNVTNQKEIEIETETDYIGRLGEEKTEAIVSRIKECEYILTNLYIPTAKGGETEIDLVAFTNRGLLVLETKNISGTIHGDEDSEQWYASLHSQNNFFYNPLKQNATHVKYLDREVVLNIPIYSIVVFSDRCSLEYLPDSFNDVYICQMSTLRETIEEIFDENPACVPSLVLSTVHSRLEKFTNVNAEVKRKHKEYVRSKH